MSGKRCMGCMNEQKAQYTVCPYCGLKAETAPDPSQIRPGTVLAQRYEVGFALKIGLYTITYIAYDLQREEKVIVKEYYPSQQPCRWGQSYRNQSGWRTKDFL